MSLDKAIRNARVRITKDANAMRAGRLLLGSWESQTRANLKDVHLYTAAVKRGGFSQLTANDKRAVTRELKNQYKYLDRLARGLESGDVANDGKILGRMSLYTSAAKVTGHRIERDTMKDSGMTLERNVMTPGEHCTGCESETARGDVPIGELVLIGNRECLSHCNCFIVYS